MNGTNEYSVNEYSVIEYSSSWAGRVKCKHKTFYDFYHERFEFLPYSSPSLYLSFSLCGLCTQQLEIANSVAAFKLFVMVEKTSRRDLHILIRDYL
jgi:hypothetical protein